MTEDKENKEVSLVGLTKKEIKASLRKLDIPDQQLNMRVNQIWGWVYNKGINSIDEMTTLSLDLREELKRYHNLERPQISDEQISKDGTKKWRSFQLYLPVFVIHLSFHLEIMIKFPVHHSVLSNF